MAKRKAAVRLQPSAPELQAAREFLEARWSEWLAERGRQAGGGLAGACVFASAFARLVFGGDVRANWHHTWIEHPHGTRIDLTGAAGVREQAAERLKLAGEIGPQALSPFFQGADPDPWADQPAFRVTRDFQDTWASVQPRARAWAREFRASRADAMPA